MSLFNKILKKFKENSIVQQTIYILIAAFIILFIISRFSYNNDYNNLYFELFNYFSLSSEYNIYTYRPYSFITYALIHTNFIHFIINIIILHYVGNIFLSFFTKKQFVIYLILGAIFGGIFFVTFYHYYQKTGILIGASASITALLIGAATKQPNYYIYFRFIGNIKLYIVALVWILLSFIMILDKNSGGQVAHIGGAFIGFVLTKYYYGTKGITFLNNTKKSKTNLKTVFKKSDYGLSNYQKDRLHQQKIDYLLDKINKSGYNSLSKEEQDFLARASKK